MACKSNIYIYIYIGRDKRRTGVWRGSERARGRGVKILACTELTGSQATSLIGSDWDFLVS